MKIFLVLMAITVLNPGVPQPKPKCTCGPTCPTPAPSTKWPIPASMEKLHGK